MLKDLQKISVVEVKALVVGVQSAIAIEVRIMGNQIPAGDQLYLRELGKYLADGCFYAFKGAEFYLPVGG